MLSYNIIWRVLAYNNKYVLLDKNMIQSDHVYFLYCTNKHDILFDSIIYNKERIVKLVLNNCLDSTFMHYYAIQLACVYDRLEILKLLLISAKYDNI